MNISELKKKTIRKSMLFSFQGQSWVNPYNNASLFLPASGARTSMRRLQGAGGECSIWSSTPTGQAQSWIAGFGYANGSARGIVCDNYRSSYRNGWNIRCVKIE